MKRHFSGPPAMPIARQPLILAICPADHADRARGARHDHRLPGDGFADIEQTEVRGHPGHAEHAEVGRQAGRRPRRPGSRPRRRSTAYACTPKLPVTWSPAAKSGMPRLDDLAGAEGAHHLTDADRRDVGASGVHPAAHRGVERDVEHPHQELAVCEVSVPPRRGIPSRTPRAAHVVARRGATGGWW